MIVEEYRWFTDEDKIKKAERYVGIRAERFGYTVQPYEIYEDDDTADLIFKLTKKNCPDVVIRFYPDFKKPFITLHIEEYLKYHTRYSTDVYRFRLDAAEEFVYCLQKAIQLADTIVDYSD